MDINHIGAQGNVSATGSAELFQQYVDMFCWYHFLRVRIANRTRIEMLPDAVFGHSLGYNGLLFDFRHQGMSGGDHHDLGLPGTIGRARGGALRRRTRAGGAARWWCGVFRWAPPPR